MDGRLGIPSTPRQKGSIGYHRPLSRRRSRAILPGHVQTVSGTRPECFVPSVSSRVFRPSVSSRTLRSPVSLTFVSSSHPKDLQERSPYDWRDKEDHQASMAGLPAINVPSELSSAVQIMVELY